MDQIYRQGLDYPAVESVVRMLRVKPHKVPRLLADLRLLEMGALAQMSEDRN